LNTPYEKKKNWSQDCQGLLQQYLKLSVNYVNAWTYKMMNEQLNDFQQSSQFLIHTDAVDWKHIQNEHART